jgi:hypothetical protein
MFGGYRQMAPQINLAAMQAFFRDNPNYFVVQLGGQPDPGLERHRLRDAGGDLCRLRRWRR